MANLLDKASIVLTPTGYSNGVYSQRKTEFESLLEIWHMTRTSAATRVNAQGLVETVDRHSKNRLLEWSGCNTCRASC